MASTYSSLKIELIGTGDQAGTWGNTTNTNLGTAIEEAITGSANVAFSSSNVALALADTNAAQTARNLRLNLTGTVSGVQYLFVPPIEKQYLITNGLTSSIIIANGANTGATGTTFTLPAGRSSIVFNDGTNINDVITFVSTLGNVTITGGTANALILSNVSIISGNINNITSNASVFSNATITSNAATLTNVSITSGTANNITSNASTFTNVSITSGTVNSVTSNASTFSNAVINTSTVNNPQINAYTEGITTGYTNTGNAYTINIATSTIITANLTANCTFTMPANTAGKSFILFLKTGAGSFTGTFTGVKWVGNTAPTITTTANRMDILTFTADGASWFGNYAQNYNPN